jgi:hypothetical protein
MSTPPVTVISPALADETAAKDPHNADKPTFVNYSYYYVVPFFI